MTTGEFATGDWVERLARALEDLARIQDAYWDELYGDCAPSSRADGFRYPDDNFRSLYLAGSGAGVKILTCTNFGTVS